MADYQEMYQIMVRACEKAMNALIEAQQKCEELYLDAPEAPIVPLPAKPEE